MMRLVEGVLACHDPVAPPVPVVFDSPHSGTNYPQDFGFVCDVQLLRQAEDTYVGELYSGVPAHGASLLEALFPRSYIDVNRAVDDLDQGLLNAPWPDPLRPGEKTSLGMGLIRRLCKPGLPMYDRLLSPEEVRHRIDRYYRPYHAALDSLMEQAHQQFGMALLVDCHSMPSVTDDPASGGTPLHADFVIGDRDGTTAARDLVALVEETLKGFGYAVRRNDPYKGVELVRRHGDPAHGRHAVQIEINRRLYMKESTLEKVAGFTSLAAHLDQLAAAICAFAASRARAV
ncbi:MAG: N-formylglutamate amidohydrolase [Rhodospirillaceae bacterium]|nr:N-formylglutamate amidohydrolase [Rhodospirillaceae bacterium]